MKLFNLSHKFLQFTYILIFSLSSHAGTAQIGSIHGFSSNAKGLSTQESVDAQKGKELKEVIQSQEILDLKSSESTFQKHAIQFYKNLILKMIDQNILQHSDFRDALNSSDLFFHRYFEKNLDLKGAIYREAFLGLEQNIFKAQSSNIFRDEVVSFLEEIIEDLENKNNVKKEAESITKEILFPQVVSQEDIFYEEKEVRDSELKNGKKIIVYLENTKTFVVKDVKTGELILEKKINDQLKYSEFGLQYSEVHQKTFLFYLKKNIFYYLDIELKSEFQEIPLNSKEFGVLLNPSLVFLENGKILVIANLIQNESLPDEKHYLSFYDFFTGEEAHPSFPSLKDSDSDQKFLVQNKEGRQVLIWTTKQKVYFLDPHTGLEIHYSIKIPFLNKFWNKKSVSFSISSEASFQIFKNSQGLDVLLISDKKRINFIDPFTGKKVYNSIKNNFRLNNNFHIFTTDKEKIVLIFKDFELLKDKKTVHLYKFIDLDSGRLIFPTLYLHSMTWGPFNYFRAKNGKHILAVKRNFNGYTNFIDIETSEDIYAPVIKTSNKNFLIPQIISVDSEKSFYVFRSTEHTVSFMDIETGEIPFILNIPNSDDLNKIIFYKNAQGYHEYGLLFSRLRGKKYLNFIDLYSIQNEELPTLLNRNEKSEWR